MEQILAFVLGVSVGVFVWTVVVAFRTASKVKNIESALEGIFHQMDRNDELVNRRIDQEIDRVNNLHKDSISYIDSRTDKLDSKIENNKDLLKG